jgi:hypothetical protein
MRNDFILDFETIGQVAYKAPAIDCSYMIFTWDRFLEEPYSFQELVGMATKQKLSIKDQITNYDFSYREEDLKWWMEQPPEVKRNIKPLETDLTVTQFVDRVIGFLRSNPNIDYWWSRANGFDPVILHHLSLAAGKDRLLNEYLPHWKVRDTRTFIDAKFNFTTKNGFVPVADADQWEKVFNAHDSAHDIAADVLRLQAIHRAENEMEQVEI